MRFLIILLAFYTSSALAQSVEKALSITEKECRKLMRMNDINGADYVPGVDLRGNKIVSADVDNQNRMELPEEISFNIGIDLAEKYDLGEAFYGKADLGQVKVKGRDVYWNGKKLGQTENQTVLDACRAEYGQK